MTKVFPYSYSWVSDTYIINSLVKAFSMGVRAAKFAFIIADNGHVAGDLDNNLDDLKSFMKMGGDLILSFGGASGTMIDEAITNFDGLFNAYIEIIHKTGCYKLDFDIESGNENKTNVNNLRNAVLVKLQRTYPNIYVSFTLAGDTNGLGNLQLIRDAVKTGVNINIINMMMMDNNFGNPGQDSITGCESLFVQLQGVYPNRSTKQIYAMMSPCIMPGRDDNSTYFTLNHAQILADYCKRKNIGELSYWALQRDVTGPTDYNLASLVNTSNLQFYNIFVNGTNPSSLPTQPTTPPNQTPPLTGKTFLGNLIQQDKRKDWIKIDNVVCGESRQYGHKEVANDIGSVLDKYVSDPNTVVVNYDWVHNKAFLKTGFNPKIGNDCTTKIGYTVFIKKNRITNEF